MEIITLQPTEFASNTYIVRENNNAVIFDAGVNVEQVKNALGSTNVIGIFITHAHYDHIFCINEYVKQFKAPIYISANGKEKLYKPDKNLSTEYADKPVFLTEQAQIITIKNGDIFEINDFKIECLETLGHSNCSFSYKLENNLFSGDVMFKTAYGRTDFFDSSALELRKTIRKIKSLAPINVFCGHEEPFALI